jgi:hypothetical protein
MGPVEGPDGGAMGTFAAKRSIIRLFRDPAPLPELG